MDTAYLFWEWGPRADSPGKLDVPLSDRFSIAPRTVTKDKNAHADIEPGDAPAFSRIYGYVASLDPSPSDNTPTGYRIEIVFKFPFFPTGHTKAGNGISHIFARVRTYASNGLFTVPTSVVLGDVVCGVTAENYGGGGLSNLGVWQRSGVAEWEHLSPVTTIRPHEFDFAGWVVEWLPCLGGAGFDVDSPGVNRIFGARLLPPGEDPRDFVRNKRGRLNKADEDAARQGVPPLQNGRRGKSTSWTRATSALGVAVQFHGRGTRLAHDSMSGECWGA